MKRSIRAKDIDDAKKLIQQMLEDGEDCDELVIIASRHAEFPNCYLGTNRGDSIAIFCDMDDANEFEKEMGESGYERLGEQRTWGWR